MKVDIIGGGIAGLSLGIYLQHNGFDTTIYERHTTAGGLCTGWKRGAYTFNGCMHWLLGSASGISFHTFWQELLDIDSLDFIYFDERVQFELPLRDRHGSNIFHFYNDVDRFEQYLTDIAPEDTKHIRLWMSRIRYIIPLLDYLPPVFEDRQWHRNLPLYVRLMRLAPMGLFMLRWSRITNTQFAKRFRNPFVRMAVAQLYEKEMRMAVLLFVQAYAAKRVAGYPIGSSLHFADKLAEAYTDAGGTLKTNTLVSGIVVADNQARGLRLADGTCTSADFVASAADWHWTVFDALGGRYITDNQRKLHNPPKERIFYSFCILYLGIAADLADLPHFFRFPVEPFASPDGTRYERLEVHIYNYDPTLAPRGCTTMAVNFQTREGQYWIDLRNNDLQEYRRQKAEFCQHVISLLTNKLGSHITDRISVADLTTPATYARYTGNRLGSSQGWTPNDNVAMPFPVTQTLPRLGRFVMAGHWMKAGGGIPIALHSARNAAWHICNALGRRFEPNKKGK